MDSFPEDITPTTPYTIAPRYRTLSGGEYTSGVEKTRPGRNYPIHVCRLKYENYVWNDFTSLYDFFIKQKGRDGLFAFSDFNGIDASPVGKHIPKGSFLIGTTDGVTVVYDLPAKSTSSLAIYRNGSLLTLTTDYTVGVGTGANSRDRITLVSAGAAGHLLEFKCTGRAVYEARINVDEMAFDAFVAMVTSTGLEIIQART